MSSIARHILIIVNQGSAKWHKPIDDMFAHVSRGTY